MPKEIERRFLVPTPLCLEGRQGFPIVQGYLAKGAMTVRVRTFGNVALLTLKGPTRGLSRDEYEYQIPPEDAAAMLESYCSPRLVQKTRYLVPHGGVVFEVDVFEGRHAGLVIAEVEMASEDQVIPLPPWLGREITGDSRFGNYALAHGDGLPGPEREEKRPRPRLG